MSEAILGTLCAVFDQLNVALLIVTVSGRVLFANSQANAMLEKGWPIRILEGSLQGKDRTISIRLKEAIDLLGSTREGTQGEDLEICLAQASSGRPGAIGCLRRLSIPSLSERAIALFIVEAGQASQYGLDGLAEAYGLSKAETRILKALVEADTPAEAAARLNIALSTVKSHLRKIFLKTNTSRQADLVRLVECCRTPFRKNEKS